MFGDAEGQPDEGAITLSDMAAGMDETDADAEAEGEQVDEDASEGEELDSEEEQEGEEEGEEQEQEEEPTVTLKHDGKEVTLKQSEAIELAQKGFDYTQKTMALGEERKSIEAERSQVAEVRQQAEGATQEAIRRLEAYSKFMETQVGTPPPISLAQQDAASYLAQKELYESKRGQLQQAYSEIQRLQDESARQRQADIAARAESAERVLRDTLPGWNDALLQELATYADGLGLNRNTASEAILEPGFWQLAQKAKAYDALQDQKSKLKPVTKLAKVGKPASTNQPPQLARRQEAMKRHKTNPSVNTLADLL